MDSTCPECIMFFMNCKVIMLTVH